MAAVVADESPPALVVGQRHVAVRAPRRPSALRTLDIGRKATPVLEQHHLSAPPERLVDLVQQQFVEVAVPLATARRTQRIRHVNHRRPRRAVALGQLRTPVLPRRGIRPRLHRRRGAPQQRMPARQPRHHHGAVPCVVARRRVRLLVARIVLLVDHDQLQVFQRQEERRPRPDHELAPLRTAQTEVRFRAPAVRELRVVGRNTAPEDPLHAFDQLRRQGDLRNQQQHVPAPRQHLGDQVDVDLRLPRARDTLQQRRLLPCGKLSAQGVERPALHRGQLRKPECGAAPLDRAFVFRTKDQPLAFQRAQHGALRPQQPLRDLARRNACPVARRGDLQQRRVLLRGPPFEAFARLVERRLVAQRPCQRDIRFRPGAELLLRELLLRIARRLHQRGKRHAHHLPRTAQVIRRHPLPQRALRRRQERCIIENTLYGFDPREVGAPVMHPPDNTRIEFVRPELHRHGLTLRDRHPLGNRERIGRLRQRQDYVGITRHQPLLIAWKPFP